MSSSFELSSSLNEPREALSGRATRVQTLKESQFTPPLLRNRLNDPRTLCKRAARVHGLNDEFVHMKAVETSSDVDSA